MDKLDIARCRMWNLGLHGNGAEAPQEIVSRLGAVQSQDYGPAKWSVGQRTAGGTDARLERVFADGDILRTHVLRPTWHFVAPADIRWMLELTAPRVHAQSAYLYRRLELDDALLSRCRGLLGDALRGGNQLTRKELAAVLAAGGITADGLRLAYILMVAELDGVVCSGAPRGKQHTYAMLEERAPDAGELSREEALEELALRYFTSHGPATAKDLRAWASLTAADVRQALEMMGPRLACEVVDGLRYWFAPQPPPPQAPAPTVHLLQAYDEYIMGYRESKSVLDIAGVTRSLPPARTVFNHIVILDGQVAGHWKRTVTTRSVKIEAALYRPLTDVEHEALRAAAARHGRFLEVEASVTTSPIRA
jgi:hypothetical protein